MSSLNPLDWMKHKIDVWETMRLDLELDEEGLLARLYDLMHRDGGPIPSDAAWLARACRVSSRIINKMVPRLLSASFITIEDGGKSLWSAYVEAELENSAVRSNKARKGADARWGRDRKVGGKRAKSSDNPAEPRESREDNLDENRKKHNENKKNSMQAQCYKEVDVDIEGVAPTEPTPNRSESLSSGNGSDALKGASGQSDVLSVGDPIEVGSHGICIISDFGLIGRSSFIKARVLDNTKLIFVPVSDRGHLMVNDWMLQAEFETTYRNDEVRWSDTVDNPAPRARRKRDAAA